MKITFKKIWNDSVFSGVISGGILVLLPTTVTLMKAYEENTNFTSAFNGFWNFKIELWIIALTIVLGIILTSLFLGFSKKSYRYDSDSLSLDQRLFNEIRNLEGMSDLILEIKSNGFSTRPVEMKRIETLIELLELSKRAEFEFLNPNIELLKKKLINEFENLQLATSKYLFGTGNLGWLSIPSEWEFTQSERMQEAIVALSIQENMLTKSYQNFISKGRNILKV